MKNEEIKILGVKLHNINFEETLSQIEAFVKERGPHLIVTLGTEMVMSAQKNREFKDIVNNAQLVCADGVGLIWAGKHYGCCIKEKVAGVELTEKIVELSAKKQWKIFFLGGAPGVAQKAKRELCKKYPDALITGTYHGFFKDDSEAEEEIRKAAPDIIFVALGSPKQEQWYNRNAEKLDIPVGIGVGGTFDVLSGNVDRAPQWMIKSGLEWLYRFSKQPSRWKRMLALPYFVLKVKTDRHKK